MSTQVRCAIYTRKSTEKGLEQEFNSLDAQRMAAEAYITSQKHAGWVCLPDRYDDGGYSGGNTERPAFQRLLADVEEGKVDCIAVYKIDRLSRSLMDFARIMGTLERHGVSLVSVTQQFNTTTSMGKLTLNILFSFAQFEREIISERTRDKIAAARRKGKWTGGPLVLGYDGAKERTGGRLVLNKAEAERVRAIFEMYLKEGTLSAAVKAIRALGWKTKRYQTAEGKYRGGVEFGKSCLQKMLTSVIYLGKMTYKGEVFDGEHPAIVDEDLFGRVQCLLRRNRTAGGKEIRNKHNAMLKGLVRCKHCGCAMSHHFATRGNKRYRYYVCVRAQKHGWRECPAPSLPAKELEDFVVEQIKGLGKDPSILADALCATQARLHDESAQLKQQREEIEERVRNLSREIGTLAPRAGFDKEATCEIGRLQNEMREEQEKIAGVNERMAGIRQRMLNPDELIGAVEAFDPMWNAMSPTQQAKLIHLLVDRIEYDGEMEAISITFHPTSIKTLGQNHREATCKTA
jgi:site-specific DNA recombinase